MPNNYLYRPELAKSNSLPSRYWEPTPEGDELREYHARLYAEYLKKLAAGEIEEPEIPFQ